MQVIYPGTFDPVTLGHLDLIERASQFASKIWVVVSENRAKKTFFNLEERCAMLHASTVALSGVEICVHSGLLVDFCQKKGVYTILRGMRGLGDWEYEMQMARMNHLLNPKVETLFLNSSVVFQDLSSSMVRELHAYGVDLSPFVPEPTLRYFEKKNRCLPFSPNA